MTTIYFIRHAESDINVREPYSRPLTEKGMADRRLVTNYLRDKNIDAVYSSPYVRAVSTVSDFAERFGFAVHIVEDFKERVSDSDWMRDMDFDAFMKRQWDDFTYSLSDGECLNDVQKRNVAALNEVLSANRDKNIVIGTHGTALSVIINHYDASYGCGDFMAMVDIMPWAVRMTFDGLKCTEIKKIDLFAETFIRPMTSDDHGGAYGLWANTPGMGLNDVDDSFDGIAKYLARNPKTCFVAEKASGVIGVILCGHDGRRGFIYHMAVAEHERMNGVGAALLESAVSALRREGVTKVGLFVKGNNASGNSFWEHAGFAARTDLVYRDAALVELKRLDT